MSLYDEIDQENYYDSLCIALLRKGGSGKFTNNQEVKRNLENLNLYDSAKKNKNYFFKMLENYNNREYVDTANESITIEHIFPINPDKQWKQDLSNEDYEDFQSNKLHTKDFWLATGAGISGLSYVFVVTSCYVAIELKIGKAETLQNKNIFREIANKKDEIESRFGSQLIWEELKEAKMSRIKNQLDGVNFYENSDKTKIIDFFCNNLDRFYLALDPAIKLLKKQY